MNEFRPKLKIDIDGTVEMEAPNIELPKQLPKMDWIDLRAERDIRAAEEALDSVKTMVTDLRRCYQKAAQDVAALTADNWKDEQLQLLKRERDKAREDMYRGFPITKEELTAINNWQTKHDTEVHNNPKQYHGASGGGYTFVFYPTGIGTAGDCICSTCKSRAIKEYGVDYYKYLKEMGGVFEFQGLG